MSLGITTGTTLFRYSWAVFTEFVFYFSVAIAVIASVPWRILLSPGAYVALICFGSLGVHVVNEYVIHLHVSFGFFLISCWEPASMA